MKLSRKASRLITRLAHAAILRHDKGAHDPSEWDEIDRECKEANRHLRNYIRELENDQRLQ